MLTIRRSEERGHFDHGWLDTSHTFSFAEYHDPRHMGFRSLRVINEDRVQPGRGFASHSHRDMEILTYVLAGALEHKDSLGNGSVMRPGDVQRMSAGTGVTHSEFNQSATDPVHLFQIWLLPRANGMPPGYEQRSFSAAERAGRLRLVAARDGRDGSVTIHQDVDVLAALFAPGDAVTHGLASGRHAWIQVAAGTVALNGTPLVAGDGAAVSDEARLVLEAGLASEVLLFDLA